METLLFTIDRRRYLIPLAQVAEVVPAVNVLPLRNAPSVVEGAVNVRGEILPVLSLRARLGHVPRGVQSSEYFIVVRAKARRAILRSDTTPEIISLPEPGQVGPQLVDQAIAGVLPMADGLALFQDVDAFIDAIDVSDLTSALESMQEVP